VAFPVLETTSYTEISALTVSHEIELPPDLQPGYLLVVAFSCAGAVNPQIDAALSAPGWNRVAAEGQSAPTLIVFWKLSELSSDELFIQTSAPVKSMAVCHGFSNGKRVGDFVVTSNDYNETADARPSGMDFTVALTQQQRENQERLNTESNEDTTWMIAGVWAGAGETTALPASFKELGLVKAEDPQAVNEPRQVITIGKNARTLIETPAAFKSTPARWRTLTLLIHPTTSTGQVVKKLQAIDTLEYLIGLCEGEIEGPVDGMKGITFNGTPLEAQDGTTNFEAVSVDFLPGIEDPEPVRMKLRGSSSNLSIGVALATDIPVTRTTRIHNIDYLDVRITIDRLAVSGGSGISNNTVTFSIEYKPSSSSSWTKYQGSDIVIKNKTMSRYPKEFRISVDSIDDTYDVRVTKITAPNTLSRFADITFDHPCRRAKTQYR